MKDIRLILEQIHNKSEVNESALSKLGWGAALAASGALGVAGAKAVINNRAQTKQVETQPTQTQPTQTQPTQTQPTYADDYIQSMVRRNEGLRLSTYKDTAGIKTIGIGHNLQAPASLETFKTVFGQNEGEKLHTGCVDGICGLTKTQAENLFKHDYISHRNNAVKLVPNLHTFPKDVQAMIVDASYRGHPGPNFIKHFNAGRWDEAAAEYINRKEYTKPEKNADGTLKAPGVIKRIEEHHRILQDFAKSQKPKSGTVNESCGCKNKGLKSRMRKKIMQRLEEAKFALVGGSDQTPSPDDIKDLEKMGLLLDLGDTTEQSTLDTFNRLFGPNPPLERNPDSFKGRELSAAQRGYQREIDVRGTGKSQTRKPAIHINGFDTTAVPSRSDDGGPPFELHSFHTLSDEQDLISNPKHYKFTVTSRIATRRVDDKGNSYHPHAGQAIHTVRNHNEQIMAVFKGGHDRPLEQISVNGDHWTQKSAGMILDPEEGYKPVDYEAEHAENATEHPLFGRTETPEERVSLFTEAIKKHLNAKVKMGLRIPVRRVRDILAQYTDPRKG